MDFLAPMFRQIFCYTSTNSNMRLVSAEALESNVYAPQVQFSTGCDRRLRLRSKYYSSLVTLPPRRAGNSRVNEMDTPRTIEIMMSGLRHFRAKRRCTANVKHELINEIECVRQSTSVCFAD